MSTPELLRLRRRVEALEENLDEQAEQVAPGVWTLPSRSRPGDFHIVTRLRDSTLLCSCEGASAGQPCRHREAVAALLEREQWEQQERARAGRRHTGTMPTEAELDEAAAMASVERWAMETVREKYDDGEDKQRQSWYSAPRPLRRVELI